MNRAGVGRPRPARAARAAWLRLPGSLSAALRRVHPPFQVRLLRQGLAPAWQGEAAALGAPAGASLHVREVLLLGGGQPLVWARSATTAAAARGHWQTVRGLGMRPLADVLYARADVTRSAIALRWLPASHPEARAAARAWAAHAGAPWPGGGWWQRSSVFWRRGQALRVCECFSPRVLATWPRPPRR